MKYVIRSRYLEDEFILTKHGILEYKGKDPLVFNDYLFAKKFIDENFPRCSLFVSRCSFENMNDEDYDTIGE